MRPLLHPPVETISLRGVLHALAEPVRLTLFQTLSLGAAAPLSCRRCAPPSLPKSSLSHHIRVLRDAGLVQSERHGAALVNVARTVEIEQRFPGLLGAILSAARTETTR